MIVGVCIWLARLNMVGAGAVLVSTGGSWRGGRCLARWEVLSAMGGAWRDGKCLARWEVLGAMGDAWRDGR